MTDTTRQTAATQTPAAAYEQVGWMVSEGLAAEFGITPLSDDYLITTTASTLTSG